MPDKDLAQALNSISFQKISSEAYMLAGEVLGKTANELWLHSRSYIIFAVLLFFVIKFWEKGIGSVVYNLIYFGIAIILIKIYGFEIIFNSLFDLLSLLAYILTGYLLRKFHVWRY